mmetsp:Transcript_19676/g.55594  ORF Transcript_19676/g.55594 Transcript_19676/m.55594 type:complete len:501 (-) Transcript_19676:319-1821(-)|eukprot:CAMPEP_0119563530 /NCGR_PEP_ID=MMETSP1352-20130426/23735_1 /TAXON_ID=265584 /ORGANISM="Stauroneis constricta, Strain CCMP1120" /LENGTH=500 /DNA_ID=CAMNT_0007612149 /DNA_START=167 /DNA_END=1669 /DNA_ORIENTATION=+
METSGAKKVGVGARKTARGVTWLALVGVFSLVSVLYSNLSYTHTISLLPQQHSEVPSVQDLKGDDPQAHALGQEAIPVEEDTNNEESNVIAIVNDPSETPWFVYNERDRQCYRACPPCPTEGGEARNAIMFITWGRAGLTDRQKIFDALSNLAAYLCAELQVRVPYYMLNAKHNFGELVSQDLRWYDFFSVLQNRHIESPPNNSISNQQSFEKVPLSLKQLPYSRKLLRQIVTKRRVITSNNETTLVQDFLLAKRISMEHDCGAEKVSHDANGAHVTTTRNEEIFNRTFGFEWRIDMNWYQARRVLRSHIQKTMSSVVHRPHIQLSNYTDDIKPAACRYAEIQVSANLTNLSNIVWDDIERTYSNNYTKNITIGTLMIRRGDAVTSCNTNLTKMEHYLKCSFEPVKDRDIALLYTTNEADPAYTDAIKEMVENNASGKGKRRLLVLDGLIDKRLQEPDIPVGYRNNYHIFSIAKELMARSDFALHQHRRAGCLECSPIVL